MNETVAVIRVIDCLDKLQLIIPSLISLIALIFAFLIPRKVMVDQIFADLIADYRSPEMGVAILSLFHFYVIECNENINIISDKYEEKYKKQIEKHLVNGDKNFSNTLHFQRRMVAQFYFNMSNLPYKYSPCLFRKMKKWFTLDDVKLLSIILHMSNPAKKVFIRAGNISEPTVDDIQMNKSIFELYKKIKKSKEHDVKK